MYRGILHWQSPLCHIVFTWSWSSCKWPNWPCTFLLVQEFEAFLISRNVVFQQLKELVSQHSLYAFDSTAGKPPVTLLEGDLTPL
jgi:hypothetical protein